MFSAKYTIGGLNDALHDSWPWMMDNNEFAGGFSVELWVSALLKYQKHKDTCLGIPIRDKVGDALETLRLFGQYWRIVKDFGFPVAFFTQDGITPEITPWENFDTLFVGGTDDHKLSNESGIMIAEAKQRGKWVHIGRVNSPIRIKKFWMADSVDGTELTQIRTRKNGENRKGRLESQIKEIAIAVEFCRNKKQGRINTTGQYNFIGE
jgi:hypothetical protein